MERFEVDGRLVQIASTMATQLDAALVRAARAEQHAQDLQRTIDSLVERERSWHDSIEQYRTMVDTLGKRLNGAKTSESAGE